MGKATKWLKSLLGMKKNQEKDKTLPKITTNNNSSKNSENVRREKMGGVGVEKRWSFAKVGKDEKEKVGQNKWFREYISEEAGNEQSKHAIAVAAATAAAADAAVAAAQAAVAVVRLTSQNRGALFSSAGNNNNDKWAAAVKIQTFFRGYLARRALRALKGLVKLQALVRGYLVRKRAAATLHSMQALIRAQATVRSQRTNQALNKTNKVQSEFRPRRSTERFDETKNDHFHSKRLSTSYEPSSYNPYEGSPKIVEIDTYKPRSRSRRINPTVYDFASDDFQYPTMSSPLPCPCPAPARLSIPDCRNSIHYNGYDWTFYGDECRISTAHSTPRVSNSIRSNGPATPTKSVCGDTFFKPNSNHPSYMADTQSFRAKLRSQSAPKQRPEGRPKKVLTLDEILAARNSISGVRMQRSCSQVQETLNL